MAPAGRKKGAYSQAARVIKILEILRTRRYGASLTELAETFSVTDRQIRRDLAALEEAGYPLESVTVDGRAGINLEEGPPATLTLSVRERFTLLATRRVFDVLDGTPFFEDVRSIYTKIIATLPDEQREDLDSFGQRFVYVPDGGRKSYAGHEDTFDALLSGVIHRRRVRYAYKSARGKAREGELEPYAIVLYKHGLYAIGSRIEGDAKEEPRIFAIERFAMAEFLRKSPFDLPVGFNVDRYFEGAFGLYHGEGREHVVVDFAPKAKGFIKARVWHDSQKISALPDGGVRVELTVPDLSPITSWVLEWGPLAVVREPASLREQIAKDLREAAAAYD